MLILRLGTNSTKAQKPLTSHI